MSEETRTAIMNAAKRRFAHYGYGKTTMAEIAGDCEMSVGNLYRFFENKEALAKAVAEWSLREKAEVAEAATAGGNAAERLRAYLMARLAYLHLFVSDVPHMHEIVQLVSTRHVDLLQFFEDRSVAFMAGIVQQGMDAGDFQRADAMAMARRLYCATARFNMPLCMKSPLEQLEAELDDMLVLLFRGLEKREEA